MQKAPNIKVKLEVTLELINYEYGIMRNKKKEKEYTKHLVEFMTNSICGISHYNAPYGIVKVTKVKKIKK